MSAAGPRPITGGAVMNAASRVSVAVTGALTTIGVARLLGPDGAGAYSVALSLLLLLTVATTLGVEHGIAYYVSSGRWSARAAMGSAVRVGAATGLLGAGVAIGVRVAAPSAFDGLSLWETAVAAAALPCSLAWFYTTYVALAIDRYEAYVLPPAAQSTLALAFVLAGAAAWGIPGAIVGLAASHVLVGTGALAWARLRLPHAERPDRAERPLRRAIGFGVKGYVGNALQLLNYRLDVFILAAVASAATVGHYAVAVSVTTVMWLLPQALSDLVFPRVAALSVDSGDAAHRELVEVKSLRHTTILVVASTAVLAAAIVLLVEPVYGSAFAPAVDLALILLPGAALIGLGGVLSATVVGRGKPIYTLVTALVATPVTMGLYAGLIPALGGTGAALASTLSYALTFALVAAFYRRVTGRRLRAILLPTRSELDDYRRLPPAVRAWAAGLRRAGHAA